MNNKQLIFLMLAFVTVGISIYWFVPSELHLVILIACGITGLIVGGVLGGVEVYSKLED